MKDEKKLMIQLLISPELSEEMDRALITEEDALRTVAYCEETGVKLLDTSTGDCIGHLRDGAMTIWVRYRPAGDTDETNTSGGTSALSVEGSANNTQTECDSLVAVRLLDIYTHRASIEEGRGQIGSSAASDIICLKCSRSLTEQKTYFHYFGFPFSTPLPRCPECGQVYMPQSFAAGKLSEVETTLEDK
jgi:hypothetical protein